jgi:hypothetical protein
MYSRTPLTAPIHPNNASETADRRKRAQISRSGKLSGGRKMPQFAGQFRATISAKIRVHLRFHPPPRKPLPENSCKVRADLMRSSMGILPMKKRPHGRDTQATFHHHPYIILPAPISLLPLTVRIALIPRIQMTRAFPNFHSAQPLYGTEFMTRKRLLLERPHNQGTSQ